jgi:hypothetical protein
MVLLLTGSVYTERKIIVNINIFILDSKAAASITISGPHPDFYTVETGGKAAGA